MLPVDEPDGKDSGGELAMEVDEVVLETNFLPKSVSSSQKTSSDFAKPPKSEVTNHLKPVKRPK